MLLRDLIYKLEELRKSHGGDREVRGIDDVILGLDGAVSIVSKKGISRSLDGGFQGQGGAGGQEGTLGFMGQEGTPGDVGTPGFQGQQGFAGTPG
jgi:hypothetical protein